MHTRSQSFSKLYVEGHNSETQIAGIYKISDLPEQSDFGSIICFLIFLYILQAANSKLYSQQYLLLLFLIEILTRNYAFLNEGIWGHLLFLQ